MNEQVIVCAGGDFRNFSSSESIEFKQQTGRKSFCENNIEHEYATMSVFYMWHLGAYMGHKKASDKQQNRDQEFLEKIQLTEKT